jgi:hypothetical protein
LAVGKQEDPKKNGTNGKYPYEACYNDCPHMKSFSGGPGGRFFKKAPLVAEGKLIDN